MKTGILFAGQGSQKPGMGKDFYDNFLAFKRVFDLLPENQKTIAFEGPMEALKETVNTQPIMLAYELGIYRVLEEKGVKPAMAAGLSLGEYAALGAAGVFDDAEAMNLIHYRAEAMAKASEGIDTVMSAVLGLSRKKVLDAVKEGEKFGTVEAANFNCPGQIVISGEETGVAAAEKKAKELGARRCMRLPVSGPFHTSYMAPAGKALEEKFKSAVFKPMNFPVVFNCTGQPADDSEIPSLLVRQVSNSVYLEDSIQYMASKEIKRIITVDPGRTTSGFVRKTCRDIQVINIGKIEDLSQLEEESH